MKTFLEFLKEQIDEGTGPGFMAGGKQYYVNFGRYYCDGKRISKEEYHAAKPDNTMATSDKKKVSALKGKQSVTAHNGRKFELSGVQSAAFDLVKKHFDKNYEVKNIQMNALHATEKRIADLHQNDLTIKIKGSEKFDDFMKDLQDLGIHMTKSIQFRDTYYFGKTKSKKLGEIYMGHDYIKIDLFNVKVEE